MLHPFNFDQGAVERHLSEVRTQAAQNRLARQSIRVRRGDQRRWRQRIGTLLLATGSALVGSTAEQACPQCSIETCLCIP